MSRASLPRPSLRLPCRKARTERTECARRYRSPPKAWHPPVEPKPPCTLPGALAIPSAPPGHGARSPSASAARCGSAGISRSPLCSARRPARFSGSLSWAARNQRSPPAVNGPPRRASIAPMHLDRARPPAHSSVPLRTTLDPHSMCAVNDSHLSAWSAPTHLGRARTPAMRAPGLAQESRPAEVRLRHRNPHAACLCPLVPADAHPIRRRTRPG